MPSDLRPKMIAAVDIEIRDLHIIRQLLDSRVPFARQLFWTAEKENVVRRDALLEMYVRQIRHRRRRIAPELPRVDRLRLKKYQRIFRVQWERVDRFAGRNVRSDP